MATRKLLAWSWQCAPNEAQVPDANGTVSSFSRYQCTPCIYFEVACEEIRDFLKIVHLIQTPDFIFVLLVHFCNIGDPLPGT